MPYWEVRLAKQECFTDEDKELFTKFAKDALLHDIHDVRIDKYRGDLTICNTITGMGLAEMVKNEANLKKAISKINADKVYEFATKKDAKRTLGSMYCLVHYKDRSLDAAPLPLRKLTWHTAKGSDKKLARPIITRAEIADLCKQATTTMDKALIWLLFESGMRIGEFIQLKKSNITQIDEGLEVKVPAGKTGERKVVVVAAAKYVIAWLDEHPLKEADAPLWFYSQKKWRENEKGKKVPYTIREGSLTAAGVVTHLKKTVARLNNYRKKDGIPLFAKDTNPHNFRHSRASELGGEPGMTEQILCRYFGWEIGSDMPRTYLHLTDEQVKRAVLRTYGRASKEEDKKIITEWECARCHNKTPLTVNYCGTCGANQHSDKLPSKIETLQVRVEELESKNKKILAFLAKNYALVKKKDFEVLMGNDDADD
ncbi:MAG: site-specific integrase [Candidatus Micrarchaeota archaeon]|nr:site-specific integrase [Candidatus Micrarchaeota archaeon]